MCYLLRSEAFANCTWIYWALVTSFSRTAASGSPSSCPYLISGSKVCIPSIGSPDLESIPGLDIGCVVWLCLWAPLYVKLVLKPASMPPVVPAPGVYLPVSGAGGSKPNRGPAKAGPESFPLRCGCSGSETLPPVPRLMHWPLRCLVIYTMYSTTWYIKSVRVSWQSSPINSKSLPSICLARFFTSRALLQLWLSCTTQKSPLTPG